MTSAFTSGPDEALKKMLTPEVDGLRMVLEGPNRKVVALAICIGPNEPTGHEITLARSFSDAMTKSHAAAYIIVLEREVARVKALIGAA